MFLVLEAGTLQLINIFIMQWKTIKSSLGNSAFGLWNNGHKMLTLAYKGKSDTIYLESEEGDKRLFHYRKKGFIKKTLVLENEYGANLGSLKKDGNTEFVEVENKRYYLNYKNNHKEVEIIDEDDNKPVATFNLAENPNDSSNYSLVMISCLYLSYYKQQAKLAGI